MSGVPGIDMRSIPDASPIGALTDMSSVERAGGKSTEIGSLEGAIQTIGPENAALILTAVAKDPELMDLIIQDALPEEEPVAPSPEQSGPMAGALAGL